MIAIVAWNIQRSLCQAVSNNLRANFMSKIYQGEDDSIVVIEKVRGKIYLSDDLDDSIITICPKSWPQIKETR